MTRLAGGIVRIVVTGAHGFVGLNVVRHLADQGHDVIALGRVDADAWVITFLNDVSDRVEHRVADLGRRGELLSVLHDTRPDVLIHAAVVTATTDEVEREAAQHIVEVNIGGTIEALEATRTQGCSRFVYISSPSAFGVVDSELRLDEEVPANPSSLYGITKLSSELMTRRYGRLLGLSTVSVRIAQPYGLGERPTSSRVRTSPIYEWLVAARNGETLVTGPLDVMRDWTYVGDTARGVVMLATAETLSHDLYHLGSGRLASVGDVVAVFETQFPGLPRDERPNAPGLNPNIAGLARRKPLDVTRFLSEFGWIPQTSVQEGLRRYLATL